MGKMFADLYNETKAPPRAVSKSVKPGSEAKVEEASPLPSEKKAHVRVRNKRAHKPVSRLANKSTSKQVRQPTDQPVDQSTDLSTMLSTIRSTDRRVSRPVAFYLSERQNEILDILVEHFKKAHGVETDRSALLRAILGKPVLDFYEEKNHEELIERLISQLTDRLISRPVGQQDDQPSAQPAGQSAG